MMADRACLANLGQLELNLTEVLAGSPREGQGRPNSATVKLPDDLPQNPQDGTLEADMSGRQSVNNGSKGASDTRDLRRSDTRSKKGPSLPPFLYFTFSIFINQLFLSLSLFNLPRFL